MGTALGLNFNHNSIGWALINERKNKNPTEYAGFKIFFGL